MKNNKAEFEFKSIDNSKNINDKDWSILSVKITKRPQLFPVKSRFCLCREIAYINADNSVSQIGKLYVPISSISNFIFFIRLLLSRKTFGHFVNDKYGARSEFIVIKSTEPIRSNNIFFDQNSLTMFSSRIIKIKNSQYEFYVEEELETN